MTKTLVGVFIGGFLGALGYELLNRNNPEAIQKIRQRVAEKVDDFVGPKEQNVEESSLVGNQARRYFNNWRYVPECWNGQNLLPPAVPEPVV